MAKKISKKQIKQIQKAAKKNPGVAIAFFVIALVVVAALAIYYVLVYMPEQKLKNSYIQLNGSSNQFVGLESEYIEKGAKASFDGVDISNEIITTYYQEDKTTTVTQIDTDEIATFYAVYSVEHENFKDQVERKIIVSDVSPMTINFLELGNTKTGDSTFIKAGDIDILIDAGSRENSADTISNFIDNYCTDGKLEYVIATHAHQDHIAAFVGDKSNVGIFEKYEVGTLIDFARTNATSDIYNSYVTLRDGKIASGKIENHYTALECCYETNGAQKSYDIAPGITMEILYQKFYENKTNDENDYSVVTLFTHDNNHYLFTGDLEEHGESSLVDSNDLPEVELFKGGHHGSYTANTDKLLNKIKPKNICICCCAGTTEYTHTLENTFPAQSAINRMAMHTQNIYVTSVDDGNGGVTSMNGDITFYSEKGKYYTITGSNNNIILKDTNWFHNNRTWPTN